MAKKIVSEIKEVLDTATINDEKDSISKEAEVKLEQQLKKDAKESSKHSGGLRI